MGPREWRLKAVDRIFAVAAWRDAMFFTAAERAALALAGAITRLGDGSDPVPDDVWEDMAVNPERLVVRH